MLRNVTSTTRNSNKTIRARIAPSASERKELGITSSMSMRILNNLREVNDRHLAEWLAENC